MTLASHFLELQLPTDLTTPARWRSINSSIADQPHHRFCHVGVAYNDALYIFGGYDVGCDSPFRLQKYENDSPVLLFGFRDLSV